MGVTVAIRECPSTEDEIGLVSEVREYFCGIGKYRPKWMQVFRNAKFFTFILCVYCCIEGMLVTGKQLSIE